MTHEYAQDMKYLLQGGGGALRRALEEQVPLAGPGAGQHGWIDG